LQQTIMIELKIAKSYHLLDMATDLWNTANPKYGQRMNGSHVQLMKQLLWLLKKQASNYQLVAPAVEDGYLMRPLRTNNKQLAKYLKCSERTVRNLRKRVKLAGWIAEVWHGSNASFEIHLNPDLLHLEETTTKSQKNFAPLFLYREGLRKILPHTPTGISCQGIKKLNELSGGETPLGLENQAPGELTAVENPTSGVESPKTALPRRNPLRQSPEIGQVTTPAGRTWRVNRKTLTGKSLQKKFREKKVPPRPPSPLPCRKAWRRSPVT
jgi:hypothetical protein